MIPQKVRFSVRGWTRTLTGLVMASTLVMPNLLPSAQATPAETTKVVASSKPNAKATVTPLSAQDLARYAKPTVVQVIAGCRGKAYWQKTKKTYEVYIASQGTGFFVNPNGYIATNAHVTLLGQDADACKSALFDEAFLQQLVDSDDLDVAAANDPQVRDQIGQQSSLSEFSQFNYVVLPNGADLPFAQKVAGAPIGEGTDVAIVKINVRNAPILKLAACHEVQLMDPVMAIGYPAEAEFTHGVQPNQEATFSHVYVSAIKPGTDNQPILQLNSGLTEGNSGGPVLNMQGEVVGIATSRSAQSHYNLAVVSDTVRRFLEQIDVENVESQVNPMYREAITQIAQGLFGQALANLLEIKRQFPQHSEVDKLATLVRAKMMPPYAN